MAQAPAVNPILRAVAQKSATAASAPRDNSASQLKLVASQKPDQLLASNFTGTEVAGANNKKIGDVSDILFDKNGKIRAYVIQIGGFLGMGGKEVAIPPSASRVESGKNGSTKLKLAITGKHVKNAQTFYIYSPPRPAPRRPDRASTRTPTWAPAWAPTWAPTWAIRRWSACRAAAFIRPPTAALIAPPS